MRIVAIGMLLTCSVAFGSVNSENRENEWALKDRVVDNFSMIPPKKSEDNAAPAAILLDLNGKPKSVFISLCGTKLTVESGADLPDNALGELSVERLDSLGWFGSISQAIAGRGILRGNTDGEKEVLDNEIKEFLDKHSCSYL